MWGEQEGNPSTLKIIRYTIFSSYFGKTLSLFFTKIYILFRIPYFCIFLLSSWVFWVRAGKKINRNFVTYSK